MNLENLNVQQKEAVLKTEGPLLVLAGAGSGKTKVLTTRIAYLISEIGITPDSILAITFTNKAAKEMKQRIVNIIGRDAYSMQISTFHSFGLSIIKDNYQILGYSKNFTILDSDDSLTVVKKILKDMNKDTKTYDPKTIRNRISSAKNELITPEEYKKFVNGDTDEVFISVYKKYQDKLVMSNALDFDDLLIEPIYLFKNNPHVLKAYQEKFKYVLVDEYQDTNYAQYLLIKMLSAKYKNICVVGDNDQSIYSFRGANYKNIMNFEKDYNDAQIITLEKNYRSTKHILETANSVIKNNKQRKEKNLWTDNVDGEKVIYKKCLDEKDEAYYVTSQIKKIKGNLSEIAVLYRTNAQSRNMEDALLKANIPYKIVGGFSFYKRKEIKDLVAYLNLIYNSNDDVSLLRIINTPKRGIGLKTLENISILANKNGQTMYDAIESGKELQFKNLIEDMKKKSVSISLVDLIEYVIEKSGLRESLEQEKSLESEVRLENMEEFKSIAYSFEQEKGLASIGDFLSDISLISDTEEYKNEKEQVTLMTIHSAKGLEFDNVFIIGLEEGIFPHKNCIDIPGELEEERRLCYVAITRAKKNLYLLNAKRRLLFGMENYNPTSRFIGEINDDNLKKDVIEENIITKNNIDYTIEYKTGDKISHDAFGLGIIVSIEGKILTIAFNAEVGIKKLMKGHKSIHKI